MNPQSSKPSANLRRELEKNFGSALEFKEKFLAAALALFGSGWIWLVKKTDGSLSIEPMGNAGNPLVRDEIPLLVCDVWEHAYYLDYENDREKYVKQFFHVVDWNFLEANLNREILAPRARVSIKTSEIHFPLN